MISTTEGIVLKSSVYGEADLIVTYLSRDFGLMQAFAKSPRKIKSRFGSSLEPLTYSRISFFGKENTALPRLTRSDIIKSFQSLREDIHCFMDISDIVRMNLSFIHEKSPVADLFHLLYGTLHFLAGGGNRMLYLLFYKIKFLEKTGYMPSLEVCGRCGKAIKNDKTNSIRHDFFINHGAIICPICRQGYSEKDSNIGISEGALAFYSALRRWDIKRLQRIKAPLTLISELSGAVNAHIGHIKGLKPSQGHLSQHARGFQG